MSEAVFIDQGTSILATDLARGPWDPAAQHGGAPAALLMRAFERFEPDACLMIGRVTYELLRPVPLGELRVQVAFSRPGRRVQLLDGSLFGPDGVEVVRARALRVRRAELDAGADEAPPDAPAGATDSDFDHGELATFGRDALEIRFVEGRFTEPGPATAWFRLRVPLVAGEEASGLQRLACAADFPNGIGSAVSWEEYTFINPDLTIYVEREPVGEWICLDAAMRVLDGGIGFSEAVLYDSRGRVGRSLQTLLVSPRPVPEPTSGEMP